LTFWMSLYGEERINLSSKVRSRKGEVRRGQQNNGRGSQKKLWRSRLDPKHAGARWSTLSRDWPGKVMKRICGWWRWHGSWLISGSCVLLWYGREYIFMSCRCICRGITQQRNNSLTLPLRPGIGDVVARSTGASLRNGGFSW
jgi:hypothetical protein